MRTQRLTALTLIVISLLPVAVAALRQKALDDEKSVRRAAFAYYSSFVLGDAEGCVKAVREPLVSIRDGKVLLRSAAELRTLVRSVAGKVAVAGMTEESRQQIVTRMLEIFDEAEVTFLGGNTATVVFLIKPAASKGTGECLGELVLVRGQNGWKVVAEVSDSKPGPPPPEIPGTENRERPTDRGPSG